jgi:hypothetical protein
LELLASKCLEAQKLFILGEMKASETGNQAVVIPGKLTLGLYTRALRDIRGCKSLGRAADEGIVRTIVTL